MNYKDFNDFELLDYIYNFDENANEILLYKYRPLIVNIAQKFHKYCSGGIDLNDLIQEGMLGLNDAINSYNDLKETNFGTFAKVCIERKMSSLVRKSKRNKHKILNESLSYDIDEENNFDKFLVDKSTDPLSLITEDEQLKRLINKLQSSLTTNEQAVFNLKKQGYNYKEIAEKLDKAPKSVDNTLQRIKTKFKSINMLDK